MQIISGKFRRRRLRSPKDESVTRPLPARVREAVFNILRGHIEGEAVFDGFAGVGTFGLEAASRGAASVVMVERDRQIAKLLRANARDLGVLDEAGIDRGEDATVRVVEADVLGPAGLAACPDDVHIVYLDPPYPQLWEAGTRRRVLEQFVRLIGKLDDTGYALIRTPWPAREKGDEDVPGADFFGEFERLPGAVGPETHVYGSTAVHLYMRDASGESGDG